jgi:hypothetical protein
MAEVERIKVRHSVSDETLFSMAMFTGVGLRDGREFYIRDGGRLYLRTLDFTPGNSPWKDEDLGLQSTPENLRKYYKDSRDATISERLTMLLG